MRKRQSPVALCLLHAGLRIRNRIFLLQSASSRPPCLTGGASSQSPFTAFIAQTQYKHRSWLSMICSPRSGAKAPSVLLGLVQPVVFGEPQSQLSYVLQSFHVLPKMSAVFCRTCQVHSVTVRQDMGVDAIIYGYLSAMLKVPSNS